MLRRFLFALAFFLPSIVVHAQQPGIDQSRVKSLFEAEQFAELESIYAQSLGGRRRNRWGEFESEEFVRVLGVVPAAQSPQAWATFDERTGRWTRQSPSASASFIVRATGLVYRAQILDSERSWGPIDGLVRDAKEALERVPDAARRDPNWHAAMLSVARLQGWSERDLHQALLAAIRAEPWALSPYLAAARSYALDNARSAQQLAALADLAVASTKASDGETMYARIYISAVRWFPQIRAQPFAAGHMKWDRLHRALADLDARIPDQARLNDHAALACLAGDKAATSALLSRVGTQPLQRSWEFWGGAPLYNNCRDWIQQAPPDASALKVVGTSADPPS